MEYIFNKKYNIKLLDKKINVKNKYLSSIDYSLKKYTEYYYGKKCRKLLIKENNGKSKSKSKINTQELIITKRNAYLTKKVKKSKLDINNWTNPYLYNNKYKSKYINNKIFHYIIDNNKYYLPMNDTIFSLNKIYRVLYKNNFKYNINNYQQIRKNININTFYFNKYISYKKNNILKNIYHLKFKYNIDLNHLHYFKFLFNSLNQYSIFNKIYHNILFDNIGNTDYNTPLYKFKDINLLNNYEWNKSRNIYINESWNIYSNNKYKYIKLLNFNNINKNYYETIKGKNLIEKLNYNNYIYKPKSTNNYIRFPYEYYNKTFKKEIKILNFNNYLHDTLYILKYKPYLLNINNNLYIQELFIILFSNYSLSYWSIYIHWINDKNILNILMSNDPIYNIFTLSKTRRLIFNNKLLYKKKSRSKVSSVNNNMYNFITKYPYSW